MKKTVTLFSFFTLVLLTFSGCDDDQGTPTLPSTYAYARLVEGVNGEFDYNDVSSSIDFTVVLVDENKGNDIVSYEWLVAYADKEPVSLQMLDANAFSRNNEGFPQRTLSFSLANVLVSLGMDKDELSDDKVFHFNSTITMTNGRVFNIDSPIAHSDSWFAFEQGISNLPAYSLLAGEYSVTATAVNYHNILGWSECEGNTYATKLRLVAEHDETQPGAGIYLIQTENPEGVWVNDYSMAGYYTCYEDIWSDPDVAGPTLEYSTLRLVDDAGALSWIGFSPWGEVFGINEVTVEGANLTIVWESDYGETASCQITRTDGTEWPEDLVDGDG